MRKVSMMVLAVMAGSAASAMAQQECTIGIGGSSYNNLRSALDALGLTYTDYGGAYPTPGAEDIVIIGMDGGGDGMPDYTGFLAGGGDVIVTGGSNYQPYRDWVSNYFAITDEVNGWHTDGAWTKTVNNTASQYMPNSYLPEDPSMTYHMLALASGAAYGVNDEGFVMGAIQDYANGGSFNYMAMDLGPYGTQNDFDLFTTPFVKGAVEYACLVPSPSSGALLGLAGLIAGRRRR